MKKKIALMTWHHTENYGTAFQAYALKKLIESFGFDVDLIDYKRRDGHIMRRLTTKYACHVLLQEIKKKIRHKRIFRFSPEVFGDFYRKHFSYTNPCQYNQDFETLNDHYHGFVCGSDQIWGPEWYDSRFFLDFVNEQRRMIAYAPSIGVAQIEDDEVAKMMKESINRFPYISLREATGCEAVRKLTGRDDVVNVLDPVIMLTADDWSHLEDESVLPPTPYCLIFCLKNNEGYFKTALNIASKKGLKPCVMHCTQSEDTRYANVEGLTPGQLLSYIKNASYICTDSFHVTVLSIVYQKQFLTFKKNANDSGNSKNNRISDLLRRLEIKGAEYNDQLLEYPLIDYDKVCAVLNWLRGESRDYLSNALQSLPQAYASSKGQDCWVEGKCEGCQSQLFNIFYQQNKCWNCVLNTMKSYPFTLQDKCYRCRCYDSKYILDNRRPQFYDSLQEKFSHNNVLSAFISYYLPYLIINLIKKIK